MAGHGVFCEISSRSLLSYIPLPELFNFINNLARSNCWTGEVSKVAYLVCIWKNMGGARNLNWNDIGVLWWLADSKGKPFHLQPSFIRVCSRVIPDYQLRCLLAMVCDIETGECVHCLPSHTGNISKVDFLEKGGGAGYILSWRQPIQDQKPPARSCTWELVRQTLRTAVPISKCSFIFQESKTRRFLYACNLTVKARHQGEKLSIVLKINFW
jgi:hypothetical protein